MDEWKPKISTCMKGYNRKQFEEDVTTEVLVAIIAFPLLVALAIASGLSPERGLYTAVVGGFLVPTLGGSRVNIGRATAATVMTVFSIVGGFGLSGLAVATIMAGLILIVISVLETGALLKYIPRTITPGFTAGIAMGIFSGQLKGFFGLEMEAISVKVLDKFIAYGKVIHMVDVAALLVGLTATGILITLPKVTTKVPASLATALMTTPMAAILDGEMDTIRSIYRELPSHFPTFTVPKISLEMIESLMPSAFALVLLIVIVSLLACVVTDGLMGEHYDSSQELIAKGVANVFCGLFGAVPVAGAVAKASNSVKSGGRTPMAGMVHSLIVLLILLFFMPLAGYIPIPTLSAILVMVAYNVSNWQEFVFMAKHAPKSDFTVLMGTFLAGVFVGLLFAVEVGVIISAVLFMKRMSNVASTWSWEYLPQEESGDPERLSLRVAPRHTLVHEIEGPVFFATVDLLMNITAALDAKVIVLRMRSVSSMDVTALHSMEGLLGWCHKEGITLILSHVIEHPYAVMEKAGLLGQLGEEDLCADIDGALARVEVIGRMREQEVDFGGGVQLDVMSGDNLQRRQEFSCQEYGVILSEIRSAF